jgi:hypothetical protein
LSVPRAEYGDIREKALFYKAFTHHFAAGDTFVLTGPTSWESEGVKRYRTEIVAERIQFGPKRQGEAGETDGDAMSADRPDQVPREADQRMDDDVPF